MTRGFPIRLNLMLTLVLLAMTVTYLGLLVIYALQLVWTWELLLHDSSTPRDCSAIYSSLIMRLIETCECAVGRAFVVEWRYRKAMHEG
jgi:hypothetical protein